MLRRILTTALLACATAFAQSPVAPANPRIPQAPRLQHRIHPPIRRRRLLGGPRPTATASLASRCFTIMMTSSTDLLLVRCARLAGAPPWINGLYDIDARVSEADLTEWQKQGPTLDKKPMLRQMLQSMLADRCHLLAHMVSGHLSPASPSNPASTPRTSPSPNRTRFYPGIRLLDGGIETTYGPGQKPRFTFYGASMADFARFLPMRMEAAPSWITPALRAATTSSSTR